MHGWIILDKPMGMSSAHAVAKVKRLLSSLRGNEVTAAIQTAPENRLLRRSASRNDKIKIGHAGTLDPLASGILPLALGEATKTVAYMMDAAKAYEFTVQWGDERDTDDAEGIVTATSPKRPSIEEINNILQEFTGVIEQMPPTYSAIKLQGKRACDRVRDGEEVALKARQVRVDSLRLITSPLRGEVAERSEVGGDGVYNLYSKITPSLTLPHQGGGEIETAFLCHCGKGTYIRSLARDMGRKLGCLGYITRLRRIKVGQFSEKNAISLEVLEKMVHKNDRGFLQPVDAALDDILAQDIDEHQRAQLRRGQAVILPFTREPMEGAVSSLVLARHDGRPVAICELTGQSMRPVRVFNL